MCESDCLTAEGLGYRLSGRTLLRDVSLRLAPGELVSLIGPNGAGKSTLLRLLAGYLVPAEGRCRLRGRDLADWPAAALARERAVMRQQNTLSFPFSAAEVVAMARAPWSSQTTAGIVDSVMGLTGCLPLAKREFRALSGGEQQRVRMAQALAQLWREQGPQGWLFLDEPTSALDLYHQQHMLRLLKQLTGAGHIAICCVLHDLNLASLWSDRVLLLHQGELVAGGAPEDILTQARLQQWYRADLQVQPHGESGVPQIFLRR
ncbi:heme ABC transporter ATP-binding protein [Martelella alba]|uniref:Heme ABC transporter ATP-binding protein n=1 Tax=Martelella alba TaxID=2590451 RepID=A0ABY2SLJ6_9HYPH|nr:heme ABC transporter ATP-binding protein [Martelella alba]TKI06599.1 heme ABC transporter ATP-binding protein [Martelella alba]